MPATLFPVEGAEPEAAGSVTEPSVASPGAPEVSPAKADKAAKSPKAPRAVKADKVLVGDDAAALARRELDLVAGPARVGEHLGAEMLGERMAAHRFSCTHPGYHGWHWSVTVARAPRQRVATVCETNLVPGAEAVAAPAWLPYDQRLEPGDVRPGDELPFLDRDPNLEQGYEATEDEDADQLALYELGLGRPRVLSPQGRAAAAQRWYDGDRGPDTDYAKQAHSNCGSCGYYLPLAGGLRQVFGVCASRWSPDDGRVVSHDHGCGAHSQTDMDAPEPERIDPPVLDEFALEIVR